MFRRWELEHGPLGPVHLGICLFRAGFFAVSTHNLPHPRKNHKNRIP